MKGIAIFTAVVTVACAQVVFPDAEESNGGSSNSNDVDSQVNSVLSTLERNIFSLQPTNGDSCSLPDGSIGNCIRFSQCPLYSNLVSTLHNPSVLKFLRTRVCRVFSNSVQICCPVGTEPGVRFPVGTEPLNAIPQPAHRPPQATLRPFSFPQVPPESQNPQVPPESQNPLFPSECGQNFADRIVQGTEVVVGAYPWLVALGIPNFGAFTVNCGGTLITRRHVLTAAHCFNNVFKPTHARVGEHDVTSDNDGANPQDHSIRRSILAGYNAETSQNDIALLILDRDVAFNQKVQPVCLPFRPDLRDANFVGNRLDVVGWGRTKHSVRVTSPVPLEAKVQVVPIGQCKAAYRSLATALFIAEKQLCAGTGGADSCNGDSGGPLHYVDQQSGRFYLVGVTSFGVECGRSDFPGVYARVGSYLDWIKANVN